jgi:hypothetical protein
MAASAQAGLFGVVLVRQLRGPLEHMTVMEQPIEHCIHRSHIPE